MNDSKVSNLLSNFNPDDEVLSQIEKEPFHEAFRYFRDYRNHLLSAIDNGYQMGAGKQIRLITFLKRQRHCITPESIALFGKTVARRCWREIKEKLLENPELFEPDVDILFAKQSDEIKELLRVIGKVKVDLEEIMPGWIEKNWEDAPDSTDDKTLFEQILEVAQKEANSDEVTLIALIGGKEASGVAELTVRRVQKTDSRPKVDFIGIYVLTGERDWLESKVLRNVREVLKNNQNQEAVRLLDEYGFEVEMKPTLVEPANSKEKEINGPSIGLPIAIALYSLASRRRPHPKITATGIVEGDGRIIGVGAIDTKIEKLALYNRIVDESMQIVKLFGAKADEGDIESECKKQYLKIKRFLRHSLEELLDLPELWIDPFDEYLVALTRFDESTELEGHDLEFYREKVYLNSASTRDSEEKARQIFPIPYGSNPLPVAKYMTKLFAKERRERFQRGDSLSPVPIIINLDNYKTLIERFQAEPIPKVSVARDELQSEDAFVFICYGDDDEKMADLCNQEIEFFQPTHGRIDPNQRLIVVAQNYHQMAKYAKVDTKTN